VTVTVTGTEWPEAMLPVSVSVCLFVTGFPILLCHSLLVSVLDGNTCLYQSYSSMPSEGEALRDDHVMTTMQYHDDPYAGR
jgi:hypothetical protein